MNESDKALREARKALAKAWRDRENPPRETFVGERDRVATVRASFIRRPAAVVDAQHRASEAAKGAANEAADKRKIANFAWGIYKRKKWQTYKSPRAEALRWVPGQRPSQPLMRGEHTPRMEVKEAPDADQDRKDAAKGRKRKRDAMRLAGMDVDPHKLSGSTVERPATLRVTRINPR